ncbi:MAG: sulfopyruvate decarboxylase subunit beta [Nitrospinaceae bacterium]|nr:sulfopyruvate decarboxylase subunit beta [Nitrospinaceae bacterium]NIR56941.1 sulfopyruvate decarboxylase subunit beta [Nitrospinaceae bacterium]NIS87397.1 sulfopyruvate decarboxylase subunit beta [Nitrospinaceae bacterium]NIT84249.1 sulfopyruvate decarboxylase subunit beta [Nitrospinaceae bacterium]NIU46437.1 sulfopyruvate decarboxylase subunit beta [Nitrospinaceae bacterium]
MKGTEAFQELAPLLTSEPTVLANGFISREFFNVTDRKENFYMIGSMGLASSIGLGVALAQPDRKTLIFDGDGNVLMAMGTLAMIASCAPKNLLHIVFDNEVYESTGSQRTLSHGIKLEEVARSAGYRQALRVTRREEIQPAYQQLIRAEGPSFLLIKVEPAFDSSQGRVTHTPEAIRDRFMESMTAD